ncbi:MAG TPA: TldD/PmbA family protein [Gemmatimonadaceae bacterium]|nr:TldD/PmbA family protein [Gemmatimonadaceae bacterium]
MTAPKRLLDTMDRASVPADAVLSREAAQALCEKMVKMSRADSINVTVNSGLSTNVRFAANQMSTAGSVVDVQVAVQSSYGLKHAVVTTNDLSDDTLLRTVREAERLARLAPDDPEAMPELEPQQYVKVNAWFDQTANASAAERAKVARTALDPSRKMGDVDAAGFLIVNAGMTAIANQKELFAYHRATSANYQLTVRTKDGTGSGWAAADHPDWAQIDFAAVAARAIDKARASTRPQKVEPGRYTVILEAQAVGDLVQLVGNYTDARTSDEGRSPFVKQGGGNKIGEKIVDNRVTLFSDPADAQLLAQPFDGEGFPISRQVWIENGVLKQLYYSRFWAKKQGKQPTGAPSSIKMSGGTASIDEMIRGTERGILVTRLWYLREVDPRTILYTGLTRDGTFLIEKGKVSRSAQNLRFNDSPLFMLNNLEALGRPERLAGTEQGGAIVMPSLKVRDFNFTSLSEAV